MEGTPAKYWRRLGVIEKAFLIATAVYALLYYTGIAAAFATLAGVIAFGLGCAVLIRVVRRSLWRLRYRLVAAYLLISVVPVGLILLLAAIAGRVIIGEMAVYLVNNE